MLMNRFDEIALVISGVLACLVHLTVGDTICNNVQNGAYPYTGMCNYYIVCHDSATTVYRCAQGLGFDIGFSTCAGPEIGSVCTGGSLVQGTANSTDYCRHNGWPTGNHPHPLSCDKFISCLNFNTYITYCPHGLLYDPKEHRCVDAKIATACNDAPPQNVTPGNSTICRERNWRRGVHPLPDTCERYVVCSEFETYIQPCDTGLHFDIRFGACVDALLAEPCNDGPRDNVTLGPQCRNDTVGDVLFILDSSSSIGIDDYRLQLQFVADLTQNFSIGRENVQFSTIVFSNEASVAFGFDRYLDPISLQQAIRSVEYIGSATFTDKALSLALQVFTPGSYGARANENHVAIVLTDGLSTDRNKTLIEAARLRNANVTILGIRIGQYQIQELIDITGDVKKVFSVEGFDAIHNLTYDITKAICKQVSNINCTQSYGDIIFVMDSSSSITYPNYVKQLSFVANVTRNFLIGKDDVRYGALIFGSNVEKLFDLKKYDSPVDVEQHIMEATYLASSTDTAAALQYILDQRMFADEQGGRPDAVKIIIVLTDGESTYPEKTRAEATKLQSLGYHMMSIGIGNEINELELNALASNTSNIFKAASYQVLDQLHKEVVTRACQIQGEGNLPDYSNFCRLLQPGVYPHPDCRRYIRCVSQVAQIINCPAGEAFNRALSACHYDDNARLCLGINQLPGQVITSPTNIDVSNRCAVNGWRVGIYPHPVTCSLYLQCDNYVTQVSSCPPYTVFDPLRSGCVDPTIAYPCNDNKNPDYFFTQQPPYTTGSPTYDYSDYCRVSSLTNGIHRHPGDCTKFIQCTFLSTSILNCPAGLAFDPDVKSCSSDYYAAVCQPGQVTNSPTHTDIQRVCEQYNIQSGIYPDTTRCSFFVECLFGVTHILQCPQGFSFNAVTRACDLIPLVNCNLNYNFRFP
uniref:DEC-1 n=1 Tax=Lymnaea stagnalis TaxID=6523 RepID=Q75R52_LYMST|nr:DEC-1 [Lymnaea stagnalis]